MSINDYILSSLRTLTDKETAFSQVQIAISKFNKVHRPTADGGKGFIPARDKDRKDKLDLDKQKAELARDLAQDDLYKAVSGLPADEIQKMTQDSNKYLRRTAKGLVDSPEITINVQVPRIAYRKMVRAGMKLEEMCHVYLGHVYIKSGLKEDK